MTGTYSVKTKLFRMLPLKLLQTTDPRKHFGIDLPYKSYNTDSDIYYKALKACKPGKKKEDFKALKRAFYKRRVKFNLFGDSWWPNFYRAGSLTDREGVAIQNKLINQIRKPESDFFEFWEILHYYSLALRCGLFELGLELRKISEEKAIEDLINGRFRDSYYVRKGLSALMEKNDFSLFDHYFFKYYGKLNRSDREILFLLRNLLSSSNEKLDRKNHEYTIPCITGLTHYVEGKSIALAGPAKTERADGEEIDSFNRVIRFNYKEKGVGIDPKHKGTKANITFFSSLQAIHLSKLEKFDWPGKLDWVLYRNKNLGKRLVKSVNRYYEKIGKTKPIEYHSQVLNVNPVLFNGTLNAVPLILFEILRLGPSKVKVFHADLMLSVNRLKGYYPDDREKGERKKKIFVASCSRNHDPVTQYRLIKTLYNSNNIECDKRLTEVLSMGESDYIRGLQKIYGQAGRIE